MELNLHWRHLSKHKTKDLMGKSDPSYKVCRFREEIIHTRLLSTTTPYVNENNVHRISRVMGPMV